MNKQSRLAIASLVILGAVAYLVMSSFSASTVYYYTVDEFYTAGDEVVGQRVRVAGEVVGSTVEWDPEKPLLTFDMEAGGQRLHVHYRGIKPDSFADDVEAVAEGVYQDGVFVVDQLLVKCPSKYQKKDG